jgi:hypothetical protein
VVSGRARLHRPRCRAAARPASDRTRCA